MGLARMWRLGGAGLGFIMEAGWGFLAGTREPVQTLILFFFWALSGNL